MTSTGIPEEVARLIADHLSSFEQLEVLLVLRRDPQRSWTPAQVASELRTSDMSARQSLEHLIRERLATLDGNAARYQAATPELDSAVRALVAVYPDRRVAVIDLIFASPNDRRR